MRSLAAVAAGVAALGLPVFSPAANLGGPSADLGVYVTPLRVGISEALNFRPGELAALQIDVVNLGSDPAQRVVVADTLPAGFHATRVATGLGRTKPKPFFACALAQTKVTCALKAPLQLGTKSLYVVGRFGKNLGLVTNDVVVSSATHDPAGDNNEAKTVVSIVRP
jgi:uncharacterized repeat protein (TIGR01451 family)